MITNKGLYDIAKKYIGTRGAEARKYCGMSGGAWCNAYVCFIFHKGNASSLYYGGKRVTYCPTSIKWCEANLAQIPLYLAMPMDIIYFDWQPNGRPDHIGFVKNKISTSTIATHEGNTSGGKVAEKTRPAKYVEGIFRPHFPASFKIAPLVIDGDFGYNSIAMLQKALGLKPTGILDKTTVRALQKKAGTSQDGAWGRNTSRAVQKLVGAKLIDGEFGKESVKALQTWINKQNAKTTTKPATTSAPAKPATPKPAVTTAKAYTGEFPDWTLLSGDIIAQTGKQLAYPKGTPKRTYTYGKGHATLAFQKAINQVYPNRTSWSKQCRDGASCDVGAGTVIRYSGADTTIPRGLQEQIPHLKKSSKWKLTGLTKTSQMKAGDVGVYIHKKKGAHIWIGIGNKQIVEANHTAKYFLHVDTDNYTSSNKKTWGIYRLCVPIRKYMKKGDAGSEIVKLQKLLTWAGFAVTADGEFGVLTEKAVKAFQQKYGLEVDGIFGEACLAKARAIKK